MDDTQPHTQPVPHEPEITLKEEELQDTNINTTAQHQEQQQVQHEQQDSEVRQSYDLESQLESGNQEPQMSMDQEDKPIEEIEKKEQFPPADEIKAETVYNPWVVESLDHFLYYCCPECSFRSQEHEDFNSHAIIAHPLVRNSQNSKFKNQKLINLNLISRSFFQRRGKCFQQTKMTVLTTSTAPSLRNVERGEEPNRLS